MSKTLNYLLSIPEEDIDIFLAKHSINKEVIKELLIELKKKENFFSNEINSYEVECPYCHDTYMVNLKDFNYMDDIECLKCHNKYKQELNIKSILFKLSFRKDV